MLAPSAPQRCSDQLLRACRDLAEELSIGVHTHLAETKWHAEVGKKIYGVPMVKHMEKLGLLSPRLTVAHSIWVDDEEIDLLGKYGVKVVHNPTANLRLGSGVARVRKMLDRGIPVGLGADSVNAGTIYSVFEQMKLAVLVPRICWGAENWISPDEAFEMGTLGGAQAVLQEGLIGSVEEGKKADLVILNPFNSLFPLNDVVAQLALCENGNSVESVFVDGKSVLLKGKLKTVNEKALLGALSSLQPRIRKAHATVQGQQRQVAGRQSRRTTMLQGYKLFDADAHGSMNPKMWEDLPEEYAARRPRAVRITDERGLGGYNTSWSIEGRLVPHPFGPGAQQGGVPRLVLEELGASDEESCSTGSRDLSDPQARLKDLDGLGIDFQVLFPATMYARMSSDPGLEAALFRAYNRYLGRQCRLSGGRVKWAGLLPMQDLRQGFRALEEMQDLGAAAAVVFGTAGERPLCHPSFIPVWDEFARTGLPLCVHQGMSYPPFEQLCHNIFAGHVLGMNIPAQLAFIAIVGHGMLDRYPDLKVGFLEFGAEWVLYMKGRMGHYLPRDRGEKVHRYGLGMPVTDALPEKNIDEYFKSGRIFVAAEADDVLLPQELEVMGEDHILYSSDFPHAEGRENSALEILERADLSSEQKQKLLYDNAVRFYGEP